MEENNNTCPICMSQKKYFNGKKYKDCKVCDDEGMVNDEVKDFHEGEEDLI